MPKIHVVKSIVIHAPVEKIYATLSNFNHWQAWSPWLIMDPDAAVKIAGDAKSYQWQGTRVGEGNMQILSEQKHQQIDYALNFIKPWKSKAKVSFLLKPVAEGVEVFWSMDSSLPFFMFWMKKMMIAFIGMDYERGLKMLKEIVEDGEIQSKLEFKGPRDFPAIDYICVKGQCSTEALGTSMETNFLKLEDVMQQNETLRCGPPFSIYHKWDMVKKQVEYTAAIPVTEKPDSLPSYVEVGKMATTKVYTLRHVGAYQHLGNAWSTLYNMQRSKEIKCQKGIHPFEVYVNNPMEVAEKDLITDIHFAIK